MVWNMNRNPHTIETKCKSNNLKLGVSCTVILMEFKTTKINLHNRFMSQLRPQNFLYMAGKFNIIQKGLCPFFQDHSDFKYLMLSSDLISWLLVWEIGSLYPSNLTKKNIYITSLLSIIISNKYFDNLSLH